MLGAAGVRAYALLLAGVCVLLLLSYELSARSACHAALTLAEQRVGELAHEDKALRGALSAAKHDAAECDASSIALQRTVQEAERKYAAAQKHAASISEKLDKLALIDVDSLQRRVRELQSLADKRGGPLQDIAIAEAKERAAACAATDRQLAVVDVKMARLNASLVAVTHERASLTELVASQDDELSQLRVERTALQQKVAACEVELVASNRTMQRLRGEIDAVIQSAGVKFDASQAVKERHIFELQAQLKEAQRDVKATQQDMTEIIRTLQVCEQRKGAATAAAAAGAGAVDAPAAVDALGFCAGDGSERGRWVKGIFMPQGCQFHEYTEQQARACLKDQRVMLYGDAALKDLAYGLFALLNAESIDKATDGAGINAAELPKQYGKPAFCRPVERDGALPGCEFRVGDSGITVEWYNEPHYHSPLLKTTIGELRQALPDVIVGGSGTEHILRQRAQWKQRLFEELPPLLEWLSKKLKTAGGKFYWRTNPALATADPETNQLLQQADGVVRAMVEMYGFSAVHVAPSTRAAGAAALAQLPNTALSPLTQAQVQMFLNRHCNERIKPKVA